MSAKSDFLLRDLATALETSLGVERATSLADLLERQAAAFLERPDLLMAHHFALRPALMIFDRRVRTMGLVETLPAGEDLQKAVRESVDRATYVRHLVLTDRDRGNCVPLAVELVLAAHHEREAQGVGEALREIARDTSYLHAIGVSDAVSPRKAIR